MYTELSNKHLYESSNLKSVERFARQNGSRKSSAHPNWDLWAKTQIVNGGRHIVTSIDNYHHARKVIKSAGMYCTSAKIGGNCVTIRFTERQ